MLSTLSGCATLGTNVAYAQSSVETFSGTYQHSFDSALTENSSDDLDYAATPDAEYPDSFRVFVGRFVADIATRTRVDSASQGQGAKLNLEKDLGLNDDKTANLGGIRWRFSRRHSLGLVHLSLDRDGTALLSRELQIGNVVFPINLATETQFDYSSTHFDYRYAFVSREKLDAGLLVGITYIDLDFHIKASSLTGGIQIEESATEEFPVPSVGIGLRYKFSPTLLVRFGATYLEYNHKDEWQGKMGIINTGVEYFPWRHVGFGLGYQYVDVSYERQGSNRWGVNFRYDGVLLRLITRF